MGSNPELIAIFKLEFYKNKKNWKLCQDVRKPPSLLSSKSQTKLNETYSLEQDNVETEYDADPVSPHNKAFLHEEPDDAPECESQPAGPPAILPPQYDQCQQTWMEPPWAGDKSDAVWHDAQQVQEWCGPEAEGVPEEVAFTDQCDGACQHLWTPVNQRDQVRTSPVPPLEYFSPAEVLHLADEWLTTHGFPVRQEEYSPYYEHYGMMDDSADFERGAHYAPHSSEVDLSVTRDECECTGALCRLSSCALSRHILRHRAALAALLTEQALRDKLYSQASLQPPIPFDDYPTRDTDPLCPTDCVLSGSHVRQTSGMSAALPGAGRGRGRLQQADRLIGIGMGRPYRL